MSYLDRLGLLGYTSPSGAEFLLNFDSLSRTNSRKAPVSEFPNQNQGAVQDLGQNTPRFPIECYISGADYDTEADRFHDALYERGPGILEHPRWGVISVLPLSVTQTEQFVEGAGRAVFQIEFVRSDTEQLEYPRTASLVAAQAQAASAEAEAAALAALANVEPPEQPGALRAFGENAAGAVRGAVNSLNAIAAGADEIRASIDEQVRNITGNIDTIVESPFTLAESMLRLYRTPADTVESGIAKVRGYRTLFNQQLGAAVSTTERYGTFFALFQTAQAQGIAAIAGEAVVTGTYTTRLDAQLTAEELYSLWGDIAGALETFGAEDFEGTRQARKAITDALDFLLSARLNLPAERVLIVTSEVTPIELAYNLYGEDLERYVERIIDYNGLSGDEIILIPAGKEVRWYVG